jgi:hypothetical protein
MTVPVSVGVRTKVTYRGGESITRLRSLFYTYIFSSLLSDDFLTWELLFFSYLFLDKLVVSVLRFSDKLPFMEFLQ